MTEPEQWAVELWRKACHDYGGASIEDTPAEWRAVMAIQRAFEERERELRKFIRHDHTCTLGMRIGNDCVCGLVQALTTRQDAPKACSEDSHDQ